MRQLFKLLLLNVFAVFPLSPLFSQEICVSCSTASTIESTQCQALQLDVSLELQIQQYWSQAFANDPDALLTEIDAIQSLATLALQCGRISNCAELTRETRVDLSQGWSQRRQLSFYEISDDSGRECLSSAEVQIENGDTTIRGMISRRTGKLSFQLPDNTCAPPDSEITRQVTVNEAGILLVDFSMVVDSFPGSWLMLTKKRVPQFQVQANGHGRLLLADDIYFDIDPAQNRITDSNLLNPDMFNSAVCSSRISNNQSNVRVEVRPGMSGRIGARYTDYGGESTERQINQYVRGIRRQSF
jgi:hypothetical protein